MNMQHHVTVSPALIARDLAERGFPVFPCNHQKRPLTPHGFKDATCDPERVAAFWAQHPAALIGVPTGAASGLFVIDLDIDDATGEALGEATLDRMGLSHLLTGPGALTPSGGRHLYFRANGLGNTAKQIGPGVDTRGEGGYIIAPGSRGQSGAYVETGGPVVPGVLPSLPTALVVALKGKAGPELPSFQIDTGHGAGWAETALAGELARVMAAQIGGRNDALNSAAFSVAQIVAGGGLDGDLVKARMATAAQIIGLPDDEAARTIESGFAAGLKEPRWPKSRDPVNRPLKPGEPLDWPQPESRFLRPELPAPPGLPLDAVFGPLWSVWIRNAAEAKAAPPDYVVAGLLAVVGATIGNTRWASPWAGWAEPPVIWAMAIGTPSMNKSPGFDAVLSPLRKLEREARKKAETELTEWRDQAEVAKLAEAGWKEATKAAIKDGKKAPAKPSAANPGPEPVRPRYAVTDATVEKLGVIIASQPRGALLFRDELAGWLQGMTRYSKGGSDRPFWLEAYGGRAFPVERMGRDPVYIDFLSIGVLGGIQPDRLKSLLFATDDDGLLARFIPIWPNAAPIKRPMTVGDDAILATALDRLLSLRMPANEDGTLRPWYVPFSEDAADLFQTYRETVRGWEKGAEGLLLSFTGKLPGLAVRLSLILAYLDYAAQGGLEPDVIDLSHLQRAALFIEAYAMPMARRAYADASVPKDERAARRLVSIIRDLRLEQFSTREILQMERDGLRTKADLDPALSALEDGGVIRKLEGTAMPKGGAPKRLFAVNPALWSET